MRVQIRPPHRLDSETKCSFLIRIGVCGKFIVLISLESESSYSRESCVCQLRALVTCIMLSQLLKPSLVAALTFASVLPSTVHALPSPGPAPQTPAGGIDLGPLAPSLDSSTKIYLPDSAEFTTFTVRWSNLEPPTPNVVIAPGTEDDVAKIVSIFKTCYRGFPITPFRPGQVCIRKCYPDPCLQWSPWYPHHTGQDGLRNSDLYATAELPFNRRRWAVRDSRWWHQFQEFNGCTVGRRKADW
jgi:hypothetical protein